jgi:lipopolysaccharide biosynthesis protein
MQNPEVARAGMNPLVHYLERGAKEGRDPGPVFDTSWYLSQHPELVKTDTNPLAHYLTVGRFQGALPRAPEGASLASPDAYVDLYAEMRALADRRPSGDTYVPEGDASLRGHWLPVRLIAFYLPQFHPIPENDAWWGKGFTEWTNVAKAIPQFRGHYQPRLPDALGFYDLRVKDVQREQIRLAKKHGIFGFCYHHYWFSGQRLLERPLQQVLDDASLDLPFCICWANENWTRRWDGQDQEVLISQDHSPEDDVAFIADIEPALRDPRYISVDGRLLLIVYRPQLLANPAATVERWRAYARDRGLPGLYLVNVHSFPEAVDPRSIGFDAAVEFPPHQYPHLDITHEVSLLNEEFHGNVYDYRACADDAEARVSRRWPYVLFPGVMTSWDNTSRRLGHGGVYRYACPREYARWLKAACQRAASFEDTDKRLVFVNAWNEWAEGTYLEPDRRYGFAYLDATRTVLSALERR